MLTPYSYVDFMPNLCGRIYGQRYFDADGSLVPILLASSVYCNATCHCCILLLLAGLHVMLAFHWL